MEPQELTQLLFNWSEGDSAALDKLMPIVYEELRRLASNYLREGAPGAYAPAHRTGQRSLSTAGVTQTQAKWQNRAQFLGVAAQLMRRILVDHARQRDASQTRRRLTATPHR